MPVSHEDLTDVDTFESLIQTVKDGFDLNNANLKVPGQQLANRTRNLKNRLDRKIRIVADIAAVKALGSSAREDGDEVFVSDKQKIYIFNAASAASSDEPWVLVPTSGTGRWLIVKPAYTEEFTALAGGSEETTTSTSMTTCTNQVHSLGTLAVGDKVFYSADWEQYTSNATYYFGSVVVLEQSDASFVGTSKDVYGQHVSFGGKAPSHHASGYGVCTVAGAVTLKLRHMIQNASATSYISKLRGFARVLKP